MRGVVRGVVVPLVVAVAFVVGTASLARAQVVIADGHVDLGPRLVDGAWTLQLRDDTVDPPAWREPADVLLSVPDTARVEVPDGPEFGFLGAVGDPVWLLPQVQDEALVWPGWNTQDPSVVDAVAREVTWTLDAVEGPGAMTVFLNEDFGTPEVLFDSREPLPQELGVEVGTHAHGNWTFDAPGVYALDVTMRATTSDGQEVADSATLRFAVGDGDAPAAGASEEAADAAPTPAAPTMPPDPGPTAAPTPAPTAQPSEAATAAGTEEGADADGGVSPALIAVAAVAGVAAVGTSVAMGRRGRTTDGGAA